LHTYLIQSKLQFSDGVRSALNNELIESDSNVQLTSKFFVNLFSFVHETDIMAKDNFSFCVLKNNDAENIFSENVFFTALFL